MSHPDRQLIVRPHYAVQQTGSPAERQPTFGFEGIRWAYQSFQEGEYNRRLGRTRTLLQKMNETKPLPLHAVTAQTFADTLSAVYTSFNHVTSPFASLQQMLEHPTLGPRLQEMVQAGVFGTLPAEAYETSKPVTDLEALMTMNLQEVHFNVHAYNQLPKDLRSFIPEVTVTIDEDPTNPYRAIVMVKPATNHIPANERYIACLEKLADLHIPTRMHVSGDYSMIDGYLGLYDADALYSLKKPLFPQYDAQSLAQRDQQQTQAPSATDLAHEEFLADVLASDGVTVDPHATAVYQKLLYDLSGGAVYFPDIRQRLGEIQALLSAEQAEVVGTKILHYTTSAIKRGQLADLGGMEQVMDILLQSFDLPPEQANRIRMYVDLLPGSTITSILTNIDQNGWVSPDAAKLKVIRDQDNIERIHPLVRRARPNSVETIDYLDDLGRARTDLDTPEVQHPLFDHLLAYVQQILPAVVVTPAMILEVKQYGEMIQLMQGRNAAIDDGRLSTKLLASLTRFSEFVVGEELPQLRRYLPAAERQQLPVPGTTSAA